MSVFVMVTISQSVRQYLPLDYYKNPDLYRMYRDWLPAYCWYSPLNVHNPISPDITGREESIKRSLISPYRQMGLILIYILQNI